MKRIFTLFKFIPFLFLFPFVSFGQGTVTSVASAPANAFYHAGGTVTITINFSTNVDITTGAGTANEIQLVLNSGATVYSAANLNVNNVGSLDLTYTVGASDNASFLNYVSTGSLTLNGTATINKHSGGMGAITLTLPATGTAQALGNSHVTIDTTPPTLTLTQPAASSSVPNAKVTYTSTENLASGTITWTRTGGSADGTVHTQTLTGSELTTSPETNHTLNNNPTLVNGAIYTVTFDATDAAGNAATTITNTNVTFDTTPPTLTLTQPATGSRVNNANVTYTATEALGTGTITWTRTGGSPDGTVHTQALTGAELTTSPETNYTLTNNPTLVSGAIYTVTFNATDLAGNAATTITKTNVTFDNTPPTLTLTQPAPNSSVANTKVTYTSTESLASGTITWTRTGGSADGTVHTQALTGAELTTSPETSHTLTNNPTLVDGAIYTVTFDATDLAGNAATTITNLNVTYDVTPPTLTLTQPASSSLVNSARVTYTSTESLGSGTITWTRTGGTADGTVHTQALTGAELTTSPETNYTLTNNPTLVTGAIYTVTFNATDLAGNTATTITNTAVTFDNTPPVLTLSLPAPNSSTASTNVTYTSTKALASGTITWTRTGGSPDGTVHAQALTGAELTTSPETNHTLTNNPTLVDGAIYTVTFDAMDAAGNSAVTITNTNVTYDVTPPTLTLTQPGPSALVSNANVTYTSTESLGSGTITWTRTGGTADGTIHTQALTGAELTTSPETNHTLTNNPTLVSGAIYTVTFNATDLAGNVATTITNTNVQFDNTPLVLTLGHPAGSTSVNNTNVTYTRSRNLASGTITWALTSGVDAGAPHVQNLSGAELTSNETNYTLSSPPTLVDGATYTVTFAGTDAYGNAGSVSNTLVKYDITPPTVSSIAVVLGNLNGIGSTNGTSNATLTYTVTFSENVSGVVAGDFILNPTGFAGNGLFPLVGGTITGVTPVSASQYTVTATPITGTGTLQLNFNASAGVTDAAGNPNVAAFSSGQTYEVVLPVPANNVTLLGASSPSVTSIQLTWTNPTVGQKPTHLLVLGKLTGTGSYAVLNEGVPTATDANFNDANGGVAIVDLTAGYTPTSTITIPGLLSGTHYDFEVIPYTLSPNNSSDNIDYLMTGTPTVSQTVTTANVGLILVGSTTPPVTISSLSTTYGASVNLAFKVQDDGGTGADTSPTAFSTLVIGDGGSSTIPNWAAVIASAELTDITGNPGAPITATGIGANSITFTVPHAPGNVGYIAENGTKEYQLRIALNSSLPVSTDNKLFDFLVNNASFTFAAGSSTLAGGQTQNTGPLFNDITVVGTALAFTTQPSPTNPFVAATLTTDPIVTAVDANGNTDTDFNSSVNVSNTGLISMNPGPALPLVLTASNGVITFPGTFSYASAGNGTLTVSGGGLNSTSGAGVIPCSAVTVSYSSLTTINAGSGTATISSTVNANPGVTVFTFNIKDDNGAGGDGAATRISQIVFTQNGSNQFADWTQVIAGATLTDNLSNTMAGVINTTNITFAGITNTPGTLGDVADNATKTYTLNIWVRSSLLGGLQTSADNKKLVFDILSSNITLNASGSLFQVAQSQNSGAANGAFTVIKTQLVVTTQPVAAQFYDVNVSPQPVVTAEDANGNTDLDYTNIPTVSSTNGTLSLANNVPTTTAGIVSLGSIQITSTSGGANGASTQLKYTDGALTATTNVMTVNYSSSSDIVRDGSFTYPTSIAYSAIQFGTLTSVNGISLERFLLRDGGGANDADGTGTNLTSITLDVTNWQNIRELALFNGATKLQELTLSSPATVTILSPTVGRVAFSGFSFVAPDNNNLALTVRASFQGNGVVDDQVITFSVFAIGTPGTISSQLTTNNPAGVQSSVLGNQNKIAVIASELDYTTFPGSAGSIGVPFGPIIVEARDANGNRDIDFTSAVTAFSNDGGATMINTPYSPDPILTFTSPSNGQLTLPANFQFTSTPTAGSHLKLSAGATVDVPGGLNNFLSPPMTVTASAQSTLTYVAAGFPTRLPYISQQAGSLAVDANSSQIAQFLLTDGNGSTNDTDGSPTVVKSIQFNITTTNYLGSTVAGCKDIREIGLFDGAGNKLVEQTLGGATSVTFTIPAPANYITAADNGSTTFSIRASFLTGAANIQDLDNIQIQLTNVQQGPGSTLNSTSSVTNGNWNSGTGAIAGGAITPNNVNLVDVVATQLDFTTQPGSFAGINQPITIPTVVAHDALGLVDLDQDASGAASTNATITTPASGAGVSASSLAFALGVLNFPGFQYTSVGTTASTTPGNGTLTVQTKNAAGATISGTSTRVDVIHITTTLATGGVTSSTQLAGGAVNKVIFGVTFNTPYHVAGQPKLDKFNISFSTAVAGVNPVFKNFRVYQSPNTSFGGPDVTTLGATVTLDPTTKKFLTVDFSGSPRDLDANPQLSFFLEVDVDPAANGATAPVFPSITDKGYPDASTANITQTQGSAKAAGATAGVTQGQTYSFAAIFPPTLVSSTPSSGQTNVPTNQGTLNLVMSVPVWTLDGVVKLYYHNGTFVQNLAAINGQYAGGTGTLHGGSAADPLQFSLPTLIPDSVYYITIAAGNFTNQTGLMDVANNLFAGFTFPGTLYFKAASPNPAKMVTTLTPSPYTAGSDPVVSNISLSGATLSATFDQKGTAYFLVLNHNAPTPSLAQVRGAAYAGSVAQGNFAITQIAPLSQFGLISPASTLAANTTYDVWMAADNDALPTPIGTSSSYGNSSRNAKAGTISSSTGTKTVTGIGTSFTTQLIVGETIFDGSGNVIGTIATITNNTNLTLTANALTGVAGVSYTGPPFEIGATGPTLTFTTPVAAPAGLSLNLPSINICTNSYQVLNTPIVISESSAKNNFSGAVGVDQTFNLVLPAGFQFDVSLNATLAPVYGTLTLSSGSDFVAGSGQLGFIGNTVLTVTFQNHGSSSLDNITISGLRVIATSATSGSITRLGGNAFPVPADNATIGDGEPVATLSAADATPITFYNTYSTQVFGNTGVTTLPNAYVDTQLNPSPPATPFPNVVQLIPSPPLGDYGPSSFSGIGVNVNLLSLTSPSLNTPFNITITHTDNNGCITQNPVQYTVYNASSAIADVNPNYCMVNGNFPGADGTSLTHLIHYNTLSAYYLDSVTAHIPLAKVGQQIMSGAAWETTLRALPVQSTAYIPGQGALAGLPNPINGNPYYDYIFDEKTILNFSDPGTSLPNTGPITSPYDYFKSLATAQGNFYWTGGSLGLAEFTGSYQSIANAAVRIKLKQNTEIFLPAIPLVEVGQANQSDLDTGDPKNPVGKDPLNPAGPGRPSNKGTPIFCEAGGPIVINGFPAASAGSSLGTFTLADATTLAPITNAAFVDNGNGTATLDPSVVVLKNGYKDILIKYTYKANSSPCQSSAGQIIRIAGNPSANFTTGNLCQSPAPVAFTGASLPLTLPIKTWYWNFGDLSSGSNIDSVSAATPSHIYLTAGTYFNVTVQAKSNNNCRSVAYSTTLVIGSTPVVNFDIVGVSQDISYKSGTTIAIPPTPTIKPFSELWDFGDGNSNLQTGPQVGLIDSHHYNPGQFDVTLTSTSTQGCVSSKTRHIITLPTVITSATQTYLQDFQSNNGDWQAFSLDSLLTPSWAYGSLQASKVSLIQDDIPTFTLASSDSLSFPNAPNKLWATSLSTGYNKNENSALFSPVFNIDSLHRPMLSFNSFVDMKNSDGVVLQYSRDTFNIADPAKVWRELIGAGVQWFNGSGINAKPGGQPVNPVGWTEQGGVKANWLESKHELDTLAYGGNLKNIVFRFALGSNSPSPILPGGFAVDNFRLGNRTRTVLVENFKNLGNTAQDPNSGVKIELAQSNYLKTFSIAGIGTQLVKLNYDVAFPATDPFNKDNPTDPSARALYYNIASSPLGRMDGAKNSGTADNVFSTWARNYYNLRSLQLAEADIFFTDTTATAYTDTLNVSSKITLGGGINFKVWVNPIVQLGPNTILQVAVLEQSIDITQLPGSGSPVNKQAMVLTGETSFENVVRKMLPSAAGTRFGATYTPINPPTAFKFSWKPDPTLFYSDTLAIVAFLQDADTKEVWQSNIIKHLAVPIQTITGLEPTDQFALYPNPADQQLTIEMPASVTVDQPLNIVDQVGRIVHTGTLHAGLQRQTISTAGFAAGVYIIEIGNGFGSIARKKVIILHEK